MPGTDFGLQRCSWFVDLVGRRVVFPSGEAELLKICAGKLLTKLPSLATNWHCYQPECATPLSPVKHIRLLEYHVFGPDVAVESEEDQRGKNQRSREEVRGCSPLLYVALLGLSSVVGSPVLGLDAGRAIVQPHSLCTTTESILRNSLALMCRVAY